MIRSLELQEKHDVPRPIAIVIATGQTVALSDEARRFLKKVGAPEGGGAIHRLRPAGAASPVVIDPLVRAAVAYEEQRRSLAA